MVAPEAFMVALRAALVVSLLAATTGEVSSGYMAVAETALAEAGAGVRVQTGQCTVQEY